MTKELNSTDSSLKITETTSKSIGDEQKHVSTSIPVTNSVQGDNIRKEELKSPSEETVNRDDAAKSLLNLSSTKQGLSRSVEVMEERTKIHEEHVKDKQNSDESEETMYRTESDNDKMELEQSEEDFVDLLSLSLSFEEDNSTSEEYEGITGPSCQDLLGHDGISEYLDHSIESEQPCLFCGRDSDRKFANMTYFCEDCHSSTVISLTDEGLQRYSKMKVTRQRNCTGCFLE